MRSPRNESKLKIKLRTLILSHSLIPYKTLSGRYLTYDAVRILISCVYDVDDSFFSGVPVKSSGLFSYLCNGKYAKPLTHTEIFVAAKFLESNGLIENLIGDKDNFSFDVTYEGMNYFVFRRKNFRFLFLNSVLLPIAVSIITALCVYSFGLP